MCSFDCSFCAKFDELFEEQWLPHIRFDLDHRIDRKNEFKNKNSEISFEMNYFSGNL